MPQRNPAAVDPQVVAELAQITPEVKHAILAYAKRRVHMVAAVGYPVASDEAAILVADAIADTCTGTVLWDRRYPLRYHLCSVVRSRTANQIRHARRRSRLAFEPTTDPAKLFVRESIDGALAPPRPDALLEAARLVRHLYRTLRRHTTRDPQLSAVLDAYALGFYKRREFMKAMNLTRREFVNARRRLDRMLARVAPDLRRHPRAL